MLHACDHRRVVVLKHLEAGLVGPALRETVRVDARRNVGESPQGELERHTQRTLLDGRGHPTGTQLLAQVVGAGVEDAVGEDDQINCNDRLTIDS